MGVPNLNVLANFNKKYGVEIVCGVAYIELILPDTPKSKTQTFDFIGDYRECKQYAERANVKHIIG